ncbi:hypothetical protein BG004_002784 [Podila humilis]|nr:hypothetical protein BG004_002784 [Podila humilis]
MLPTWIAVSLSSLLLLCLLPIPIRSQSAGASVQFPTSSPACITCWPAFGSPACQEILTSIEQVSSEPISNATLTSCQCTGSFLSLYNTCVQCFTETRQLNLVFGSNQAPTLTSLESFCKSAPVPVPVTVTTRPAQTTPKEPLSPNSAFDSGTNKDNTQIQDSTSSASVTKSIFQEPMAMYMTAVILGWAVSSIQP